VSRIEAQTDSAGATPCAHVSHRIISTVLRHDSKQTSYRIALLRSLNDVVLARPDLRCTAGW